MPLWKQGAWRLERLIRQLEADEPTDRRRAVSKLVKFGATIIPRLVELMSEGTWRRRNAAALCLEQFGWKPSGESENLYYLIARWEIKNNYNQIASTSSPITEHVLPLLSDPWGSVREKALLLLKTDSTGLTITGILEAVERGDLSSMSVVQVLREKLNDSSAAERATELLLVRMSLPPKDLEHLTNLLGERFDQRFVPTLSDALKSKDANIRLFAARALHRLNWQPGTLEERLEFTIGKRDWTSFAVCFRENTLECLPVVVRLLCGVEHNRETSDYGWVREFDGGATFVAPRLPEYRSTLADGRGEIVHNPKTPAERDLFLPQGALRTIIRLGIPNTESALEEILNTVGDKYIAVDYLNCGNERLDKAAREWASQRNYKIIQLPHAEKFVRWGQCD